MRFGARPASPELIPAALPRAWSGTAILVAGEPVEGQSKVLRDGLVGLADGRYQVGFALAGRIITLRLDGHLMHAIADSALGDVALPRSGRPSGTEPRGTDGDVTAASSAPADRFYPGPVQGVCKRPFPDQRPVRQARPAACRKDRHRRHRGHPLPDPARRGRTRCQAPQEPRTDHQALRQRHGPARFHREHGRWHCRTHLCAGGKPHGAPDLSSPSPPGTTAASAARTRWLISVHSTLSAGVVKDHRGAVVKVDPAAEDLLPELFSRCVRMNQ